MWKFRQSWEEERLSNSSSRNLGKDHPETGMILGSLGDAWRSLSNYEKSKELLTQALEIEEKHYI